MQCMQVYLQNIVFKFVQHKDMDALALSCISTYCVSHYTSGVNTCWHHSWQIEAIDTDRWPSKGRTNFECDRRVLGKWTSFLPKDIPSFCVLMMMVDRDISERRPHCPLTPRNCYHISPLIFQVFLFDLSPVCGQIHCLMILIMCECKRNLVWIRNTHIGQRMSHLVKALWDKLWFVNMGCTNNIWLIE